MSTTTPNAGADAGASYIRMESKGAGGAIAVLTIDRSQALNALNRDVLTQIKSAVAALSKSTRVLILTGAGEKAFVAGADIAAMANMDVTAAREFVELGQGVMQLIEDAPMITIAAVNGFALGGGLELALSCDLIYASTNARLGLPETNLGIIPGFGGTTNLLARIGLHRAMDLILSGRHLSADDAKVAGLVAEVFALTDLMPKVLELAEKLSKKGSQSLLAAKRLLRINAQPDKAKAYARELDSFAGLFATGEPQEGMKAFLEKREAKF